MTATPDTVAGAVVDVYGDLERRGSAPPSRAVQMAAMGVIGRGHISARRALTYDVPSESEPGVVHVVALYLRLRRDRASEARWRELVFLGREVWRNEISGARCSCPNRAELGKRPPCKHMTAALALARLDGYRLEVPR